MASYVEVGAFIGGTLGVPYLMGGNTLGNIGRIVIHSIWGGPIVLSAVGLALPQQQGEDDRLTRISTLAHQIFFYGVTIALYLAISPQLSILRCAAVCIGSLAVIAWAQSALGPNSKGRAPETVSEIRFYSLTSQAAWTLFISSLVSGIARSFFS